VRRAADAIPFGVSAFLPTPSDLIVADLVSAAQELRAAATSLVEVTRARVAALQQIETALPEMPARRVRRAGVEDE